MKLCVRIYLLLGVVATVSVGWPLASEARYDALVSLLPIPVFGLWLALHRVGVLWSMTMWTVVLVACLGSAIGTLQADALANRCTHAIMAMLLGVAVFVELDRRFTRLKPAWILPMLVYCLMMTIGATLEMVEALLSWDQVTWGRWHDTVLDLWADGMGALVAVVLTTSFSWLKRRQQASWPPQNP